MLQMSCGPPDTVLAQTVETVRHVTITSLGEAALSTDHWEMRGHYITGSSPGLAMKAGASGRCGRQELGHERADHC